MQDAQAPATTSWPGLDTDKRPSIQASEPAYSTHPRVPAMPRSSAPAHPEYYYQAVPTTDPRRASEPAPKLAPKETPDVRRASEPAPATYDEMEGRAAEQRRSSEPPLVQPHTDTSAPVGMPPSFLDEDYAPNRKASLPPLSTHPSCGSLHPDNDETKD